MAMARRSIGQTGYFFSFPFMHDNFPTIVQPPRMMMNYNSVSS